MGVIEPKVFEVTVTSKGQMTLPVGVRDALGIVAGDRLALEMNETGEIHMVKKTRSYRDTIGLLAHLAKNRTVPIEMETEFAMTEAMTEQDMRSKALRRERSE